MCLLWFVFVFSVVVLAVFVFVLCLCLFCGLCLLCFVFAVFVFALCFVFNVFAFVICSPCLLRVSWGRGEVEGMGAGGSVRGWGLGWVVPGNRPPGHRPPGNRPPGNFPQATVPRQSTPDHRSPGNFPKQPPAGNQPSPNWVVQVLSAVTCLRHPCSFLVQKY